jgi:hypothetical protein
MGSQAQDVGPKDTEIASLQLSSNVLYMGIYLGIHPLSSNHLAG